MILCVENSKKFTEKLLENRNEYNNFEGYNINLKILSVFSHTSKEQSEK